MKRRTRDEHLFGPGPKRILALDGGGIRGIVSLQLLRPIEKMLQERTGDADLRLCDYFDLIGGTSTGAIIAAGLAIGKSVDELDGIYRELGKTIFDTSFFRKGILRPKFPDKPLRKALEKQFGDTELGDPERIRTGLGIVTKRLDSGSPWILHNNPRGKYFDRRPGSRAVPNRNFPLRDVVRASTAAPHYFAPEKISVAEGVDGAFVDGGVSPHNNPALQLLMLANLEGHGLGWRLGADELFLVSIGTGSWEGAVPAVKVLGWQPAELAVRALSSMMNDSSALNEQLLQWMSRSPTARPIDREVGDLRNDVLGGAEPWLTYLRYEAWLEQEWLESIGVKLSPEDTKKLKQMDEPKNLDTLADLGQRAAEHLVRNLHFPAAFDVA